MTTWLLETNLIQPSADPHAPRRINLRRELDPR
jgi:hypothetical protein